MTPIVFFVSFILLTQSAVVQTAGQTCEDIDTSICTKLGQIYSGFCNDSCISKLCRRSCGMCPVKCYECHEVDEPRLCTNVTQCPDIDHYCFATRSFADNFKKIYKLGCAPKSICKENFGSPGKRDLRVDAACCSDDQCNNRFPEEIQGSSYTTSTKEPTETSSTIKECQNIDEDICTRIAALYPGFCINESCAAAKLCPRMCRQCFRCYSCNEVDNVKDCNVTALCQGTKQCFSMETLSMDDLRPVIRLGCMETKTCQRFTASPGIIFGKRQSLQPKGGCCHSDLCNHNLASSLTTQKTIPTPSPTTTTATPRPTVNSCNLNFQSQCPTGYIAHNNFCYLFGTVSMSWNDAKNYCTSHCGSLIDFVSDNEMGHTMRYFLRYGPGHLHIDGSYWSAATTHLGSVWVWDSTGKHLTSDFTHDLGTTRFGQCGSVHHHLESTSCASRFPPACKTTIRSG
ncbi:Hypothetical predicted protein [Mytilus galloprovincialis]|uniref:C-type lectin domain-containing protein n=1 Tax=Mytilus galloprovincialis TaxID=29158 RepID=A0A8B6HFD7_MYTGA|nr:Hypothetical predicted protein [Mytilus galloprovincialis]